MALSTHEDIMKTLKRMWNNNEWLSANTNGLYPELAPKNISIPFVVFNITTQATYMCQGISELVTLTFNIYADGVARNPKECQDIMQNIRSVFNGVQLAMDNHANSIAPRLVSSEIQIDDKEIYHGFMVYIFRISEVN